jgi:hypothetical protein
VNCHVFYGFYYICCEQRQPIARPTIKNIPPATR